MNFLMDFLDYFNFVVSKPRPRISNFFLHCTFLKYVLPILNHFKFLDSFVVRPNNQLLH